MIIDIENESHVGSKDKNYNNDRSANSTPDIKESALNAKLSSKKQDKMKTSKGSEEEIQEERHE